MHHNSASVANMLERMEKETGANMKTRIQKLPRAQRKTLGR